MASLSDSEVQGNVEVCDQRVDIETWLLLQTCRIDADQPGPAPAAISLKRSRSRVGQLKKSSRVARFAARDKRKTMAKRLTSDLENQSETIIEFVREMRRQNRKRRESEKAIIFWSKTQHVAICSLIFWFGG
jgi:hypothetical protein